MRDATVGAGGHLQWLRQVHGDRCVQARAGSCSGEPEADAVWTDNFALGLVIQTADCVPIVVTDTATDRIGAAHAGWRGLARGVVGRLIDSMGSSPSMMAWIGPAIGPDAYEVGEDVRSAMHSALGAAAADSVFVPGARPGKWQLDLHGLAKRLLAAAGVEHVYGDRLCTFSDSRFHSYRRDGGASRMATVVWKNEFGRAPVAHRSSRAR